MAPKVKVVIPKKEIQIHHWYGIHKSDVAAKPTGREAVRLLRASRLLPLCTFKQDFYSLTWSVEQHIPLMVGTINNVYVEPTAHKHVEAFVGLGTHNKGTDEDGAIDHKDELATWALMRSDGKFFTTTKDLSRKLFIENDNWLYYLLSDVVDKIFMCKNGGNENSPEINFYGLKCLP